MSVNPPRREDDRALSSVLGAILLFGLLVVTLVSIQVQFVPRWEEEREARHMDQAVDQLGVFRSDVQRLVTNSTQGGITSPLTLASSGGGFTFFRSSSIARAEADFTPSASGDGVLLSSPQLRIQLRDGEELFGIDEDWNAIPSTGNVSDISKVRHLRVRVDMIPGSYDDGDSSTLTLIDANNAFAGKAVVTFRDFPSEQALETTTFNAANQQISSGIEAFFQQTNVDYFYIDLLDPELLFDDVLAAAAKPLQLQLANSGLDADYTVVFTDASGGSGGSTGGLVVSNYANTLPSGSLALRAGYQHLPDQTFVMEHGGLLVVQADGAAMLVPPNLVVSSTAQQTSLDWVVPGLDGSSAGLGGDRALTLAAYATGQRTHIEALAARISLTLPTAYPSVWGAYFNETLTLGGLDNTGSDPQFTVITGTSAVQVDVFGPIGAPTDGTEDIFLRYQQATLALTLIPSG